MSEGAGGGVNIAPARARPDTGPDDPASGRSDLLRAVAAGTATVTGEAFFRSLTRQLAQAFGAEVAFVAEMLGDPPERARVLAVSHDERRPARGLRVPRSRARRAR